ncbi:hypothetical protein BHM03_00012233 [Ensete ventricosum]|nr:hypothetical protein BHM03_00012233 [Ensete ventricosum]
MARCCAGGQIRARAQEHWGPRGMPAWRTSRDQQRHRGEGARCTVRGARVQERRNGVGGWKGGRWGIVTLAQSDAVREIEGGVADLDGASGGAREGVGCPMKKPSLVAKRRKKLPMRDRYS